MTTAIALGHVLVGTAGHIDHGKTRLIGRLTGIDTDRLPEEKTRGISIDLGFAHWESGGFQFGVVDVPGHERFVKNMVAGATGINLALLVVAADDGVMPQTREHLEIMDLLGVRDGVVAITKIDLVEPDFVELVQAEIEELTQGTFLERCAIVPVSSETGAGVDELRETLTRLAAEIEWPQQQDLFRMPIDRVFTLSGQGSIVTGSVQSGDVHPGDVLELLPEGRRIRVRSVEHHGIAAGDGCERQRTAINPAGVKADELARGQELATPGYLKPTHRLLVELRSLPASPVVLKDRLTVNLHLGTSETPARIVLKGKTLKPGERAYAELRTTQPVLGVHGQRFIIRRLSPATTIGGGRILDPEISPSKRIKALDVYAAAMDTPSERDRLSFLLSQTDGVDPSPLEAARRAGVDVGRYESLVEELKGDGELIAVGPPDRRLLVHRTRLETLAASVLRTIRTEIEKHQPRRTLPQATLMTACRGMTRPELLEAVLDHLLQEKRLIALRGQIGLADGQVKLTKKEQQALTKLLESLTAAGLTPPTVKALAAETGLTAEQLAPLLVLCEEDGLLVRVSGDFYFTPESIEQARHLCEEYLREHGEATMSSLRETWGVTRKFAVPLCEYFDSLGITVRRDDMRIAGPKLGESFRVES